MPHSDKRFPTGSRVRTYNGHFGTVHAVTMHDCSCHSHDAAVVKVLIPQFGNDCIASFPARDVTPLPYVDAVGWEWRVNHGVVECRYPAHHEWLRPSARCAVWTEERVRLLYALFELEKSATQGPTEGATPYTAPPSR